MEHQQGNEAAVVAAFALSNPCVREAGHSESPPDREVAASMTDIDDNFAAIRSFIESNYERAITIDDFTAARGISRRSAQEALSFHAKSWLRLLLDVRMQRARELLSYSGETVEVIAGRCGYPDAAQFTRSFKIEEGKEPEEYRQWMTSQQSTASPRDGSPSS
jgi:AraC-like DNA-binding protein